MPAQACNFGAAKPEPEAGSPTGLCKSVMTVTSEVLAQKLNSLLTPFLIVLDPGRGHFLETSRVMIRHPLKSGKNYSPDICKVWFGAQNAGKATASFQAALPLGC